ncbi:MAG: phospholipid carrier-dependent glycosyltransferase [Actinomycetota bacterium]
MEPTISPEIPEPAPVVSRPWYLRSDFQYGFWVTLFAGIIHFVRLNIPKSLIPLDEFYYPVNALGLMRHGADYQLAQGAVLPAKSCASVAIEPAFAVHPPVGKWLIAAGMRIFGCNSFGWRFSAAIFGTLAVLLVYLIGRRLFKAPWAAALAAFFVATDGLFFIQSRIAMLDIFLSFFIVLAIWLILEDRARTAPDHRGWRWWRISSAIAIGLGAASKWSAAVVIPFIAVIALAWEIERLRSRLTTSTTAIEEIANEDLPQGFVREPINESESEPAHEESPDVDLPPLSVHEQIQLRPKLDWLQILWNASKIGATFALIPMAVYLLTYVPWFASGNTIVAGKVQTARYTAPRCVDVQNNSSIDAFSRQANAWLCYQREIWDFHKNLATFDKKGKPSHPYLSRAWSWPWMGRPTSHYFDQTGFDPPCGQKHPVKASGVILPAKLVPPKKHVKHAPPTVAPVAPVDASRPCKADAEILGLPNPASWFGAFWIAIPLLMWWTIMKRDQVAAMLLLLFAPLFLPWLVTTRPLFLFYMTPAVPILALMLAHVIHRSITELSASKNTVLFGLLLAIPFTPLYLEWMHTGSTNQLAYKVPLIGVFVLVGMGLASLMAYTPHPKRLAVAYAGLVLAVFAYFYPVLAAVHIPDSGALGWRKHMWVQIDCGGSSILLNCWI